MYMQYNGLSKKYNLHLNLTTVFVMNFYNDINDNTYFATPKSAIFMRQSELSKIFFVFKSL